MEKRRKPAGERSSNTPSPSQEQHQLKLPTSAADGTADGASGDSPSTAGDSSADALAANASAFPPSPSQDPAESDDGHAAASNRAGRRRVTLRDVAAHAGVSTCTASKILSGRTGGVRFNPTTQQRVLDAARALQFVPSMVGRSLVGGRSMTIGVIVKGLQFGNSSQRLRQLIEFAQDKQISTLVASIVKRGDDSMQVLEQAKAQMARGVDGLIIDRSMPLAPQARRALENLAMPVVYMGWGPARSAHRIVFERDQSLNDMAAHLASLGHRDAAYFPTQGQMDFPELRLKPVVRAFTRHGLKVHYNPRWLVHDDRMPVMDAARQAVEIFLQDGIKVTAMVMNNDEAALSAMNALRQAGLKLPEDMSVIGFDDIPLARHCQPTLTTVARPDSTQAIQAALQMLCQLIDEPQASVEKQVISSVYRPRDSVAQARSAHFVV